MWVVAEDRRAEIQIPRDAVTRLEVSNGRKRHVLQGLAIGAGVGLALGLIVRGGSRPGCDDFTTECLGEAVASTAGGFAALVALPVLGGAVGLGIGLPAREQWKRVETPLAGPSMPGPSKVPAASVSLSFSF